MNITGYKTGLAKMSVHCSADTFVMKIVTFVKPEKFSGTTFGVVRNNYCSDVIDPFDSTFIYQHYDYF